MTDNPKSPDDGDKPSAPNGDNMLRTPSDGGSLPPAMVHRDSHTPMTKAE